MFDANFHELERRLKTAWKRFEDTQSRELVEKIRKKMEVSKYLLFEVIEEKQVSEFSFVISILDGTLQEDLFRLMKQLGIDDPSADRNVMIEVLPHGELLGTGQYEALDYHWVEPFIAWLECYNDNRTFPTPGTWMQMPDVTSFAIFGDWGGGCWNGNDVAKSISHHIQHTIKPDYSIHLGDVYYVGLHEQEQHHLLALWPHGARGNFTLNSNHEMYPAGKGYFDTALTHDIFKQQQGKSFFALENKYWVVVGLDSAFHADKDDLYMFGNLDPVQKEFLAEVKATGKNVIVLCHHNPLDITGTIKVPVKINGNANEGLWHQVHDVLGERLKYWYWGHVHAGAVYKPVDGVNCRVLGHGVVPWGYAAALAKSSNSVAWFEHNKPVTLDGARVQNGFAFIRLAHESIVEAIYGEDGLQHWPES